MHFHPLSVLIYQPPSHFGVIELIGLVSDLVTIVGVFGIVLAYFEFRHKNRQAKVTKLTEILRAISAVKYQLQVIGVWTNFEDGGYAQKDQSAWIQKERITRGDPFHTVFKVESLSVNELSTFPAAEYFSEEINEAIAWVNQWLTTFNYSIQDIKNVSYSRGVDANIILHKKLHGLLKKKLTASEDRFVRKMLEMYTVLHFQIIGDENTKSLHYWHKKLKKLLDELEEETQQKLAKLQ